MGHVSNSHAFLERDAGYSRIEGRIASTAGRQTPQRPSGSVRTLAASAFDVILETLWPTRCAVCDRQDEASLCRACEEALLHVDDLLACPRCGAPYGKVQCTECNDVMLASMGLGELPFDHMSCALILDDAARRIVTTYKDHDDHGLAAIIARIMSRKVTPEERRDGFAITFIPDTEKALLRRGFDHSEEIAVTLAGLCGMPCAHIMERPSSHDQRGLGRKERISNMAASMRVRDGIAVPDKVLLVDDVRTTGATVMSACLALRKAGVETIHVLVFTTVLE